MEHTIFLNEKVDGYQYIPFQQNEPRLPPIEVRNAENLISEFCEQRANTFTVFFSNNKNRIFLGYGVFFSEMRDSKGRKGLHFRHFINLTSKDELCPTIVNLLKLLETEGKNYLFSRLQDIALSGSSKVGDIKSFLRSIFEIEKSTSKNDQKNLLHEHTKIKKITHNVGGLTAFAWIRLAESKVLDEGNWSVFEKLEGNKIVTQTTDDGIDIQLSDLILQKEPRFPAEAAAISVAYDLERAIDMIVETARNLEQIRQKTEDPTNEINRLSFSHALKRIFSSKINLLILLFLWLLILIFFVYRIFPFVRSYLQIISY